MHVSRPGARSGGGVIGAPPTNVVRRSRRCGTAPGRYHAPIVRTRRDASSIRRRSVTLASTSPSTSWAALARRRQWGRWSLTSRRPDGTLSASSCRAHVSMHMCVSDAAISRCVARRASPSHDRAPCHLVRAGGSCPRPGTPSRTPRAGPKRRPAPSSGGGAPCSRSRTSASSCRTPVVADGIDARRKTCNRRCIRPVRRTDIHLLAGVVVVARLRANDLLTKGCGPFTRRCRTRHVTLRDLTRVPTRPRRLQRVEDAAADCSGMRRRRCKPTPARCTATAQHAWRGRHPPAERNEKGPTPARRPSLKASNGF